MAAVSEKQPGAIYVRLSKSAEDQAKLGDQEKMCRTLADSFGVEIAPGAVYVDDGLSGYSGKRRDAFERLLGDVQAGAYKFVLAQSQDRFARNDADKTKLQIACAANGVKWLTVNEGMHDPATAVGEFLATLNVGLARMESHRKSERQRQSNEEKRLRGVVPRGGRRPFGYQRTLVPGTDRWEVRHTDPFEAKLVEEAYRSCLRAEGTGLSAVRTLWKNLNVHTVSGRPWTLPSVEKVLRRAFNAGLVEQRLVRDEETGKLDVWPTLVRDADGNPVRGDWDKIIDESTYFAVLAKLNDPSRRLHAPRPAVHLVSSIATCVCGVPLRVAGREKKTTADGAQSPSIVYRCGVHDGAAHKTPGMKHVSIVCEDLDRLVSRAVCLAMTSVPRAAMPEPSVDRLQQLHADLTKNRRAQADLLELVGEPGFDPSAIKARQLRLKAAETEIVGRIDALREADARAALVADLSMAALQTPGRVDMDEASALLETLLARFSALPLVDRRALVRSYVDVRVLHGRPRVWLDAAGNQRRDVSHRVAIKHKIATALNTSFDRTEEV